MAKILASLTTFAVGATLAGCMATPVASNVTQGTLGAVGVTPQAAAVAVTARLHITTGEGLRLLATIDKAYNLADIDHVVLSLQKSASGGAGTYADVSGFTAKHVARADLGSPLTLSNLRMDTYYKVTAKVYADAGEATRLDNGLAADNETTFKTPALTSGGASQTNTANADTIDLDTPLTIKAKLKNKTYNGTAKSTPGAAVTNGTFVDPTAVETF